MAAPNNIRITTDSDSHVQCEVNFIVPPPPPPPPPFPRSALSLFDLGCHLLTFRMYLVSIRLTSCLWHMFTEIWERGGMVGRGEVGAEERDCWTDSSNDDTYTGLYTHTQRRQAHTLGATHRIHRRDTHRRHTHTHRGPHRGDTQKRHTEETHTHRGPHRGDIY